MKKMYVQDVTLRVRHLRRQKRMAVHNRTDLTEALKEEIVTSVIQTIFGAGSRKHNPISDQLVAEFGVEINLEFGDIVEKEIIKAAEKIVKHKRIKEMLEEVRLDESDMSLIRDRVQKMRDQESKSRLRK
jgi:hypothetical protein